MFWGCLYTVEREGRRYQRQPFPNRKRDRQEVRAMADAANTTPVCDFGTATNNNAWQSIGEVARRIASRARDRRVPKEAAE